MFYFYIGIYMESVLIVGCNENSWNVFVYFFLLFSVYLNFVLNDFYMGEESCKGFIDGNYFYFMLNYIICGIKMIVRFKKNFKIGGFVFDFIIILNILILFVI